MRIGIKKNPQSSSQNRPTVVPEDINCSILCKNNFLSDKISIGFTVRLSAKFRIYDRECV